MWRFILGFILGVNISLFLYACIFTSKKADEKIKQGGENECGKSN